MLMPEQKGTELDVTEKSVADSSEFAAFRNRMVARFARVYGMLHPDAEVKVQTVENPGAYATVRTY